MKAPYKNQIINRLMSTNSRINNFQIDEYYRSLPSNDPAKKSFGGVYFINDFPPLRNNQFYILNIDTKHEGTHWVMLYRKNNNLFYYDSFSIHPGNSIINYARRYGYNIHYNPEDNQSLKSSKCGFFAMAVGDWLSLGIPWNKIVLDSDSILTKDPSVRNVLTLRNWFLNSMI